VTPPSTQKDKASSLDKNKKNDDVRQVKETVSKSGKPNSTSASSAAVGNGRATEDKTNVGRQNRAHLWSSSNGTKQSSSRSSTATSLGDNVVDDSNRNRSNQDEKKIARKNVNSKLSKSRSSRGNVKESNDAGKDKQNNKSGETSEKQSEAKKESLSKRKSSKQLHSISGSRDAIRSFSRKRGQKSTWKGDFDEDERKNKSWKDNIGSSPKKKSFIKRLGSKLSGKSASVGKSEVGKSSGVSLYTIAPATPTTKEDGGRSQFQQRAASKRAVRSNSPPSPQVMRRRQSLSPDRSESSQNSHDKERFYSRSRSTSPRRNRRSLSPHSS